MAATSKSDEDGDMKGCNADGTKKGGLDEDTATDVVNAKGDDNVIQEAACDDGNNEVEDIDMESW
jgi:hypothetical protein